MYYLITLVVYGAVDVIACLGLSLQFGIGGVTNFGFIIFQAAGAYTAAILALPADTANGGFQTYHRRPEPAVPVPVDWRSSRRVPCSRCRSRSCVGRRLRGDFAAVGLLVTAVLRQPARDELPAAAQRRRRTALSCQRRCSPRSWPRPSTAYQWEFAAGIVVLAACVYWFVRHITESPYGRTLRAMRDNDKVADSLGKNLQSLRTSVLLLGGAIAGLSGGVLVSFISVWSPAAWTYAETIVLVCRRDHRRPRESPRRSCSAR